MALLVASLNGAFAVTETGVPCDALSACSGHGTCHAATGTCSCTDGWGSTTDIAQFKSPDCRFRVCPAGKAWFDIPIDAGHAHNNLKECSNAGLCNRLTGQCECFPGFAGDACQRSRCPSDCSGHGQCVSIKDLQTMANAAPFGHSSARYGGDESSRTWDEDRIYVCVCDSSWTVGYGAGEVQAAEWFGPDCSQRHCPSADDPRTKYGTGGAVNHAWLDETNCYLKDNNGATWRGEVDAHGNPDYLAGTVPATTYVGGSSPPGGSYVNAGASGNLCHVDCSNRGICDHSTGVCACFAGSYGEACQHLDVRAKGQ
jgi:hypothetical protein